MTYRSRIASCKGRKEALLIGINYSNTPEALKGCETDVERIQKWLIERHNFHHINTLTEKTMMPTKDNILESLKQLALRTHQGVDVAVIHYSGHGTHVADLNKDEDDLEDEAWYTVDKQILLDDEIRSILNEFSPWCNVLIIIDACHSGTSIDLPIKYIETPDFIEIENKTAPLCNVLMISGSRDSQTSADAFLPLKNKFGGAMTDALMTCCLDENVFDVLKNMNKYMKRHYYTQRPQISSSRPLQGHESINAWLTL